MKAENLIIPAKMRRKDMFQNEIVKDIKIFEFKIQTAEYDLMFDYQSKTLNTP